MYIRVFNWSILSRKLASVNEMVNLVVKETIVYFS